MQKILSPHKTILLPAMDVGCPMADIADIESLVKFKKEHPNATVVCHINSTSEVKAECEKEVRALSNYIGSTSGIIDYATKSDAQNFIIVTEQGVHHELKKKNPNKNFYTPGNTMTCVNMKKTTLEDIYHCLLDLSNSIEVEETIRLKALNSLVNMHNYAR